MKNRTGLKKYLIVTFGFMILSLMVNICINMHEYKKYRDNFNDKIDAIVFNIQQNYPNVSENELMEILNGKDDGTRLFEEYGIDVKSESIVLENDKLLNKYLIIHSVLMLITSVILVLCFLIYNEKKDREIKKIAQYIENINQRNYGLDIDSMSEDELSILKNEIYKTTVMLKEIAENSVKDKKNLKKSLEDISHQLKTPLTSILVILDNLIEEPDMDVSMREEFVRVIKREIVRINFLIQTLLKLSKFDSNTIHFIKEQYQIREIIDESVGNVSALCDLKNIKIIISGDEQEGIRCDFKWQVEAVTNIIKNCIDHSKENGTIEIKYEQNKVYSAIIIKDYGDGIDNEDLPHIFERFYKGKNSSADSVGIGLALSKTIIEENDGNIDVVSDEYGTKFTIKYFNIM